MSDNFQYEYSRCIELARDLKYKLASLDQKVNNLVNDINLTEKAIAACEKKKKELQKQKSNPSVQNNLSSKTAGKDLEGIAKTGFLSITQNQIGSPSANTQSGLENILREVEKELDGLKVKLQDLANAWDKARSERDDTKSQFVHKKSFVRGFYSEAEERKESSSKAVYNYRNELYKLNSDAYEAKDEFSNALNLTKQREMEYEQHSKILLNALKDLETEIPINVQDGRNINSSQRVNASSSSLNSYSGLDSIVDKFKSFSSPKKIAEIFSQSLFPLKWVSESIKRYSHHESPRSVEHQVIRRNPNYYNSTSVGQTQYQRSTITTMTKYTPIGQYDYNTHSTSKR